MTQLINEFIAEGLAARTSQKSARPLNLPAFDMGRPRVNLADREALEAMMEQNAVALVVDTNVLLYAVNRTCAEHESCVNFLRESNQETAT